MPHALLAVDRYVLPQTEVSKISHAVSLDVFIGSL